MATNETKHTPGQWNYETVPDTGGFARPVVTAEGGSLICAVSRRDGEHAESKANARLIAAAPDLLAALREIVAHERCDCGNAECWFCRGQAAIAKAEGR